MRWMALLAMICPVMPAAGDNAHLPAQSAQVLGVTYVCERGACVEVSFINRLTAPGLAVALIDGRTVVMEQVVSASGIRYRSVDPATPYAMFGKGDCAHSLYGPEETAQDLLSDCRAIE